MASVPFLNALFLQSLNNIERACQEKHWRMYLPGGEHIDNDAPKEEMRQEVSSLYQRDGGGEGRKVVRCS